MACQGASGAEAGFQVDVTQANITIEDCEFKNNSSSAYGAGLDISASGTSSVAIRNNVFSMNTQTSGTGQGAGASIASYGPSTIENNTFSQHL